MIGLYCMKRVPVTVLMYKFYIDLEKKCKMERGSLFLYGCILYDFVSFI